MVFLQRDQAAPARCPLRIPPRSLQRSSDLAPKIHPRRPDRQPRARCTQRHALGRRHPAHVRQDGGGRARTHKLHHRTPPARGRGMVQIVRRQPQRSARGHPRLSQGLDCRRGLRRVGRIFTTRVQAVQPGWGHGQTSQARRRDSTRQDGAAHHIAVLREHE